MIKPIILSGFGRLGKFSYSLQFTLGLFLISLLLVETAYSEPVDVSSSITVTTANERSVLDRTTRMLTSTADITITNSSGESISSPLHAVIEILDTDYSNVTMPDALGGEGTDPYSKYYFNLSGDLSGGILSPGQSVTFKVEFVRFYTIRFQYNIITYGNLETGPVNQPPTADPGGPYTGIINQSITFDGSGSNDPDADTLTYSWDFGDGTSGSGEQPTHTYTAAGTYTVNLIVSDGQAQSDPAGTQVTVTAANIPPVADAGANRTLALPSGQTQMDVTLDGSGSSDADGTITGYVWSGTPDPSDIANPVMSLSEGTYTFTLVVTDDDGASSTPASVTITIEPAANTPPVADAGANRTLTLPSGQTQMDVTLDGSGSSDADGTITGYVWSGTPDPADIAGPVMSLPEGTYTFTLVVTDDDGASSTPASVTITIEPAANTPPVADAGANRTLTLPSGQTQMDVTLDGSGSSDADGTITGYVWSGTPDPADIVSPVMSLSEGIYTFTLVVTDNDGASSTPASVTINIQTTDNAPPVIEAIGDLTGPEMETLTCTVSASDPDENYPLTFSYNETALPSASSFSQTAENLYGFSWQPGYDHAGDYTVTFTVTDSEGHASTHDLDIHVTNVNRPPVLDPLEPQQVSESNILEFTISGTDPDSDVLIYTNGPLPEGSFFDTDTRVFSWTPTYDQASVTPYMVTFTATDPEGLSDSIEVLITVNQMNRPPVLDSVADQTVDEGNELILQLIGSDPDGDALTFAGQTLPPGAALDEQTGVFSWTPGFFSSGTYQVRFTASDGYDISNEIIVTIVVNDINQTPEITTYVIRKGRIDQEYRATIQANDPDGDELIYTLTESPAGMIISTEGILSGWTPGLDDIGSHTITVDVSDDRGGTDSRTYNISIADTIPPALRLNAPSKSNPGLDITVEAFASDNDAITALEINGNRIDYSSPYPSSVNIQQQITVSSELGTFNVQANVWDTSDNVTQVTAEIDVVATFDKTPPEVLLNVPSSVAPGQTILLTASASDDVGVSAITFFAGGAELGSVPVGNSRLEYIVASDAVAGETLNFSVTAVDFSGNSASDNASSVVVVSGQEDTTEPETDITTPDTITEEYPFTVVVETTDEDCLSQIDVYVNHTLAATSFVPEGTTFDVPVPDGIEGGMNVLIEVVVTDCSGNQSSTSKWLNVEEPSSGVLLGEVYNDSTGLPLEGADIFLFTAKGEEYSVQSDSKGRFSFTSQIGSAYLQIEKQGFTSVERYGIQVQANTGIEVYDARLTPLDDEEISVSSVLGKTFSHEFSYVTAGFVPVFEDTGIDLSSLTDNEMMLEIPAGALSQDNSFTITQISPQGPAGMLPGGWSPIGIVDIDPYGVQFQAPANLAIPNMLGLNSGSGITLARWDETTHAWMTITEVTFSPDEETISAPITLSGQYAFLVPDALPSLPPDPVEGEELGGITATLLSDQITATVSPEPSIIFYQPGVHSDVGVHVSEEGVYYSSGTMLLSTISEEYLFYSGNTMVTDPFTQDIVLYSFARTSLTASYTVTPSHTFEALSLDKGIITVDALASVDSDRSVNIITEQGGTIAIPTGESITIPEYAVSSPTPVEISSIAQDDLAIDLPPDLVYTGGISISFGGKTLSFPATLSIPAPEGLTEQDQVILVRLEEIKGATRFVLAGICELQSDQLVSVYKSDWAEFEGVYSASRYLFLQLTSGVGFASGDVKDTDGDILPGALVMTEDIPVVSLSAINGSYTACVPVDTFTISALNMVTMDSGDASGTINQAGDVVEINISLIEEPPFVLSTSPLDDAENVPLETSVKVTFSEPLDPVSVNANTAQLTGPNGIIEGTLSLTLNNTTITFRPSEALSPDTYYTFTVSTGIQDLAGYSLDAPYSFAFTCLDTTPPPAPEAGAISATIPEEEGTTTISATQGTAGVHDTVSIINKTQDISTPVLVNEDGSFSATIDADIIDEVVISITDPSGNETIVPIEQFRNPDGSTVIGPEGGQLQADNGVILDILAGTFPNGAIVRITGLTEAQIGVDPGPDFPFVAGFELNCSVQPEIYMNASAPLPQGTGSDARGIVAMVAEIHSGPVLGIVDTAKVINGRLATSSPPCPGIFSIVGRYGMYLNEDQMMAMGEAIMSMIAPADKPYVMNPLIEAAMNQYTSWFPAYSDVFRGLYHASASPASQEYPGEAYSQMHQQICMPVPANAPLKVRIEDAETGELIDIIDVDPIEDGGHADITIKDYEDTEGPTTVEVIPLNDIIGLQDRKIKIRFSEPISWESADSVTLMEESGEDVYEGKWELTENNCLLTFEPDRPLALGKTYRLNLANIKDLAGNVYSGRQVRFVTFEPYVLFPSLCGRQRLSKNNMANDLGCDTNKIPENLWFIDVDFKTRTPAESYDGKWHTDIVALQANKGRATDYRIFTIDASDPTSPRVIAGFETDSRYLQRSIHLLDDVPIVPRDPAFGDPQFWKTRQLYYRDDDPSNTICADPDSDELNAWLDRFCSFAPDDPDPPVCTAINGGCGDLAVTTVDNTEYAYLWSYDVTDRNLPDATGGPIKWISSRLLSDNGAGYGKSRQYEAPAGLGTVMGLSALRGMDISHDDIFNENTVGVYVANYGIGLELVDLGLNIPTINDSERQDPQYPPANAETLQINTQLYYRDVSVVDQKVVAIAYDLQGGTGIKTLEIFRPDLAGEPLGIVQLTNSPKKLATVADFPIVMDGDQEATLFDLAFVTGEDGGVSVIEIPDNLSGSGNPYNINVYQNRIPTPDGVVTKHIQIDPKARVAYVAALGVNDKISGDHLLVLDISQPFKASSDANDDGWDDRFIGKIPISFAGNIAPVYLHGFRLDTKRGLIYAGIYAGGEEGLAIIKVRECPDVGVDFTSEPGSSPVPIKAEKYALQQVIQNGLSEAQSTCGIDPATLTMIEQGSGSCIWNDSCTGNYQPGVSDHDFEVFFPPDVSEENKQCVIDALYNQVMTIQSDPIPVSAYGYNVYFKDITFYPMDRESFESALLDLNRPAGSQGDIVGDMGLGRQQLLLKWLIEGRYVEVPGLDLKGNDFRAILEELKEPMDMNNDGEDDEPSHIQRLEGYEWARLQEAMIYKSGALIRIKGAAEPGTTLHKTFTKELHTVAKAAIRAVLARIISNDEGNKLAVNFVYDMPVCVDAGGSYDPYSWNNVSCESFSHYITSLAARMVRDYPDENLFTPEEVSDKITKFYKVKAGLDDTIDTEEEAIDFIRDALTFIEEVGTQTQSIYDQTIGIDPRSAQRIENMAFAENQITNYRTNGKKHIIPRFFNNSTIAMDDELQIRIYQNNQEMENRDIWINAGDYIHLDTEKDPPPDNDDPDVLLTPRKNIPVFSLDLDQTNTGQSGWISILIDIPDHNIQERYRENNWAKLFYYVLDPDNPAVPGLSPEPELAEVIGEPEDDLLNADLVCECEAQKPTISVVQSIPSMGGTDNIVTIPIPDSNAARCVEGQVTVTNLSDKVIKNIRIFRNYGGDEQEITTLPIQELPPGESITENFVYCITGEFVNVLGILWVDFEYQDGIYQDADSKSATTYANLLDIRPVCAIGFIPLDPDPNPEISEVNTGGSFCRYYQLISSEEGPVANAILEGSIYLGVFGGEAVAQSIEFRTNEDGYVVTPLKDGSVREGLWIDQKDILIKDEAIPYTLRVTVNAPGTCAKPLEFDFKVKKNNFDEKLRAGAYVDIEASLLGISGSLSHGAAFEMSLSGQTSRGPNEGDWETAYDRVSTKRSLTFGGSAGFDFKTYEFEQEMPGLKVGVEGPSAAVKLGINLTYGDKYEFALDSNTELEVRKKLALALNYLSTIQRSPYMSYTDYYIISMLSDMWDENGNEFLKYKSSEFWNILAKPSAELSFFKFEAGCEPVGDLASAKIDFSAAAGASLGMSIGTENFLQGNKTVRRLEMMGSANAQGGLSSGLNTVLSGVQDPAFKQFMEAQEAKLLYVQGNWSRGVKLAMTLDQNQALLPERFDFSFEGEKGYGFYAVGENLESRGQGTKNNMTYSITKLEDIVKVARAIEEFGALLDTNRRDSMDLNSSPTIPIGPESLYVKLMHLISLIRENAEYSTVLESGKSTDLRTSIAGKIAGTGLGLKFAVKTDQFYSILTEKGVIKGSKSYVLEDYQGLEVQSDIVTFLYDQVFQAVDDHYKDRFHQINKAERTISTEGSSQLSLDNDEDFNAVLGPLSFDFVRVSGPIQPYHYAPEDVTGSADKPYYGIGGFHEFFPVDMTLSAPASLTIDYDDSEIVGIDEGSLALYTWNYENKDWDYVGGDLDIANNKVTVEIDRLGAYTIAPAMPSGEVTWATQQAMPVGENTMLSLISSPLVMNNGEPVPDGTLFHVASLIPYIYESGELIPWGTVLTEDARLDVVGSQVVVENGILQIELQFPGGISSSTRIVVFSDEGTALGDEVISIITQ